MRLTKTQRVALKGKYGGRCAYCGEILGDRWHADHVEPVLRESRHVKGRGFVATGRNYLPEHDRLENLQPACAPCNIHKSSLPLYLWRRQLADLPGVLARSGSAYRQAVRFGLIQETGARVVFYFERAEAQEIDALEEEAKDV